MPSKTGNYGIRGHFGVDITEFVVWGDFFKIKGFRRFLRSFLIDVANKYIKRVRKKTPVDTGLLYLLWHRDNPTITKGEAKITIYNEAPYSSFVEYGHRGVFVPLLGVTLHTHKRFTQGVFMMNRTNNQFRGVLMSLFYTSLTNWFLGKHDKAIKGDLKSKPKPKVKTKTKKRMWVNK